MVTFSDRAAEVSGTVARTQSDRFVIIFSPDRAHWFYNSRRVSGTRPDREGRYAIRNLPPGDYFVALADVDQGEWFDPGILEGLAADAIRIRLAEHEQKKLDL